jgi:hypothetical protein
MGVHHCTGGFTIVFLFTCPQINEVLLYSGTFGTITTKLCRVEAEEKINDYEQQVVYKQKAVII